MAETVRIEGLSKLRRELKAVDAALPKELNKIGKDAAGLIADTARGSAPSLSGTFAAKIKPGATAKGAYVALKGLVYAKVIHFGWPRHNIAPQPVIYEALDDRRGEVIDRYRDGINKLLADKITRGTGGAP